MHFLTLPSLFAMSAGKPVSTPDQVRGRLFSDIAREKKSK
jgi:hypothetical protein